MSADPMVQAFFEAVQNGLVAMVALGRGLADAGKPWRITGVPAAIADRWRMAGLAVEIDG